MDLQLLSLLVMLGMGVHCYGQIRGVGGPEISGTEAQSQLTPRESSQDA